MHEAAGRRSWRLQFDVRSATQTDVAAHESPAKGKGLSTRRRGSDVATDRGCFCRGGGGETFGPQQGAWRRPWRCRTTSGRRRCCAACGRRYGSWSRGDDESAAHEARWLNLTGFALRPGYGFAVDDWRVGETWRNVLGKLAFPASQAESLVLWRRIAGGLSRGQQLGRCRAAGGGSSRTTPQAHGGRRVEAAAWPSIQPIRKKSGASWARWNCSMCRSRSNSAMRLWNLFPKRKLAKVRDAMVWAVGRLGQRVPLHGMLNTVVPSEAAASWATAVIRHDADRPLERWAVMQLARRTDDRRRDLHDQVRAELLGWLRGTGAAPTWWSWSSRGDDWSRKKRTRRLANRCRQDYGSSSAGSTGGVSRGARGGARPFANFCSFPRDARISLN